MFFSCVDGFHLPCQADVLTSWDAHLDRSYEPGHFAASEIRRKRIPRASWRISRKSFKDWMVDSGNSSKQRFRRPGNQGATAQKNKTLFVLGGSEETSIVLEEHVSPHPPTKMEVDCMAPSLEDGFPLRTDCFPLP